MLQKAKSIFSYLLAKIGFDTAENEPAKKLQKNCKILLISIFLILLILLLDRRPLRLRPPVPLRPPRGHRRADGAADDRRAAGPPRPTAKLAKLAESYSKIIANL